MSLRRGRLLAALTSLALVVPISLTALPTARADDTPRTVTLVGSLQSELGCDGDWQPDCTKTDLAKDSTGATYSATVTVPAGSYEYKVAINHAWDESYGPAGGGDNGPLVLAGSTALKVVYDDKSHLTTLTPLDVPGPTVTAADRALATPSLRSRLTRERFYFLMADRFANGSTANDTGGLTGGAMDTGYDPTAKGFYHGGDLKGVISKLDYIKGMGTTAIWLTPSFKNRPVQGTGKDASAGYHGYWITDFTQIDPHLGTNADMKKLISSAHAKGMKVFFDIITNHTADVIKYAQPTPYTYRSKADYSYKTADGTPFDDRDYVNKTFPALDPATSFPYTPVFDSEADKTVKVPAWLNDPTLYHNRGDTTYVGENATYGDFAGLDDLFTENPKVVSGMTDIYNSWVDLGIDGFRIDTVKHVNTEFWQKFSPAVLEHAKEEGNSKFFMFGEVYDSSPAFDSTYTTTGALPATLDFGFQSNAQQFAQGNGSTGLRDLYAGDDYYTDADSNAYELPTFLGNHDMGRLAMMLTKAKFTGADRLKRLTLADQLMYLTRGQPVTYYGDEQGFIGAGGDQDAREDLFATKTAQYADEENAYGASASGAKNRYSTKAPLYRTIKRLSALRAANPALADGAQIQRYASATAGVFAVSRINPKTGVEYIVAVNDATTAKSADFETFRGHNTFRPVYGNAKTVTSRVDGRVTIRVPALGVAVWKATRKAVGSASAPVLYAHTPGNGGDYSGRAEIRAGLSNDDFAQVSFGYRVAGSTAWTPIGTDDNAPYRVFHDVSGLANGTVVEYRMVSKDLRGRLSAASSFGIVGTKGATQAPTTGSGDTSPQPANASIPGDHNSEMGCAGDWQPDCDQAQMTKGAEDDIWRKTITVPAGQYAYKVAYNKAWDTNYGAGGALNGGNIAYDHPDANQPVSFFYDHRTHNIQNTDQGPIIAAAGDYQSEMGCAADWEPGCLRTWLGDPDGDGVYTWTGTGIPAGDYNFKIAYNESWDVNYGAGGVSGGDNIAFHVPSDGLVVSFSFDSKSHVPSVAVSAAPAATDLSRAKAFWLTPSLLAWPADGLPAGVARQELRWRLHASADGTITDDKERLYSDHVYNLRYDPAGLPASVLKAYPQLAGYVALRLDHHGAPLARRLLRGQVAVGLYDDQHKILDGTGVQIAPVLDSLYGSAAKASYGISWSGGHQTFRLWAPTARSVALLTWPRGSADAPASAATRHRASRHADGSWTVRASVTSGTRYLYEVKVFAPTTGKVETNRVTDPYSVALTLDSTRSVAVDLADRTYMPSVWRTTTSPKLTQAVDSTIYELHVRDFSINDQTVPASHRGSYLAFDDRSGDGYQHLKTLAAAGLNTVHLLPTFDIASIEEDRSKQAKPDCDLASYAPDSEEQQACVTKTADADAYNWGYDPWHWMAPEGSYASSNANADGGRRVSQFRTMVGGLHSAGLRVVLDQVFNHTPSSGEADTSVLDQVVPGYYQRLDAAGAVETSTCCQNVATENAMAQKIMVDSVVTWARSYHVDGFRFDLMGHSSRANMLAVRSALNKLTLARDGVDGKKVYLYGEGWNFGEVADNARFYQATQGQLGGTGIGTFSDRMRDAVRGGGPFDDDPRLQGLGSGLVTDPNAADQSTAAARLANSTDLAELGLAGNLRAFTFRSAAGAVVRGDQVDYNGAKAGYADQPDEVISYVDAHDNETLWDALTYKLPVDTSMADRIRMNTVSLSFTALSQTPSFWHAGADLLRSKSLDRNSFNSGDWFNRLDWTGQDNGFGHGLPPKADNESKWPYQKTLLADPALKPTAAEVQTASAQAQELLRLRFSSALLRLGRADLIEQKVSFPASGTSDAHDGVIVMRVDDTVGRDVDPALKNLVVVFNASDTQVAQKVPGLTGPLVLSPVQAAGADAVVKTSSWDASTSTLTVPARTVAVFVQPTN